MPSLSLGRRSQKINTGKLSMPRDVFLGTGTGSRFLLHGISGFDTDGFSLNTLWSLRVGEVDKREVRRMGYNTH